MHSHERLLVIIVIARILQCFDAVDWVTRMASGH